MIQAGDRIPEATVHEMNDGRPQAISSSELLGSGRTVLFALPGAFTPTCSAAHLPGFVVRADELRAKGVEQIVCLSVNDAFVMDAWGREHNADDRVRMIGDGNGDFSRALGLTFDASGAGLGERSQRYAMVVEDGVVRDLAVEEPGKFEVSSAEAVLARL